MTIPSSERHLEELTSLLRTIRQLVDGHPGLVHTWRLASSAVWTMGEYYALEEQSPRRTEIDEAVYVEDTKLNIETVLGEGQFSQDWQRGFWFNATIMRLDALWERVFKVLEPRAPFKCPGRRLYALVQARRGRTDAEPYEGSHFQRVRRLVNELKHEPGGSHPDVREDSSLPMAMFQELLVFINDPVFTADLAAAGRGPVLAGRRKRR